jgi:hypothetical protein
MLRHAGSSARARQRLQPARVAERQRPLAIRNRNRGSLLR